MIHEAAAAVAMQEYPSAADFLASSSHCADREPLVMIGRRTLGVLPVMPVRRLGGPMKSRPVVVLLIVLLLAVAPNPASAASRLPVPTITSAVATSATSIDVAWTSVDRATSYEVRWTAYGEVQTLSTTLTSAQLKVFAATPYTVEVRAISRNATSPWSPPVFLTTPPAPPSSVVATAVRPDTVQLTWDTGYGEASYEVYAVASDGTLDGPLSVRQYGAPNRVLIPTTAETTSSYAVMSVAYDGQRSVPSDTVTVTTPPRWQSGLVIPVYGRSTRAR
jgi:Fibronectin type III domain